METGTLLISIIIAGIILFIWTGITQNLFPWGTKSVSKLKASPGTGEKLATTTTDGMMYTDNSDSVVAFIAVKPKTYYNMGRFFAVEFVTQIIAGFVLTLILALTSDLTNEGRLALIALIGAASVVTVDLQYWNWWGFSTVYTVGVAVNRVLGFLIAAAILIWLIGM